MADEDARNDGPSLELPSLGFGRRRRRKSRGRTTEDTAVPPPGSPAGRPPEAPEAPAAPEEPTTVVDEPLADTTRFAEPVLHEPASASASPPLDADEVAPAPAPAPRAAPEPEPGAAEGAAAAAPARRARRRPSLPTVGGLTAAVLTGLVVGLATVGLTWASLRLCEVARGTSSCGGPGFLLLLAIVIAMVVLGALLLRVLRQPDPGSTSFLAVGLLAVVTLLFLVDVVFDWWMVIAIPLFSVLTFVLAHWVTATFVEPAER